MAAANFSSAHDAATDYTSFVSRLFSAAIDGIYVSDFEALSQRRISETSVSLDDSQEAALARWQDDGGD